MRAFGSWVIESSRQGGVREGSSSFPLLHVDNQQVMGETHLIKEERVREKAMRVRYHGITDEQTTCDHCGRQGLKRTVMLFILDGDGNADELTYFGTACAAKALGTTSTKVSRAAMEAEVKRQKEIARLQSYLSLPDITGRTLHMVRVRWNEKVRTTNTPDGYLTRGIIDLGGVKYGPLEGPDYGFRAFAVAQEAAWRKELESLTR